MEEAQSRLSYECFDHPDAPIFSGTRKMSSSQFFTSPYKFVTSTPILGQKSPFAVQESARWALSRAAEMAGGSFVDLKPSWCGAIKPFSPPNCTSMP
jgi:hypothetical protein